MNLPKKPELINAIEVKFNVASDFADIILRGGISLELMMNSFVEFIEHPNFRYNMNVCYDFSHAFLDMDMQSLENYSQFVFEHASTRGNHYKLAMVSTDTLGSALLSVYKLNISKTSVDAEIFSRKPQAVKWLMEKE